MARNYEKRFTGLNRFLEAKQRDEQDDEKKPRPPLSKLHTPDDVKKWIPSIQREIAYLLQQISRPHESRNYTDAKIKEFKERIEQLKSDHKKFVAKVQSMDPTYKETIPWQNRGYARKRSHEQAARSHDQSSGSCEMNKKLKLKSALLEREAEKKSQEMLRELEEKRQIHPNPLGLNYSSDSD